jgi:hypothetical protein
MNLIFRRAILQSERMPTSRTAKSSLLVSGEAREYFSAFSIDQVG